MLTKMLKKTNKKLIAIIISSIIILVIFETYISLALHFPFLSKFGARKIARQIYMSAYRNVIHFNPECSIYDPELTYILKPGVFRFNNPEFDTVYKVNSAGLRDEENSLIKPDMIVLGDSLAMGWGVEQNETYSKIIEKKSKLKVLNAAISSYGTAREIRLLNRLDTSNLKYLIIHYMNNDYSENKTFYTYNILPKITDEKGYNNIRKSVLKRKKYYLAKYSILTFKYLLRSLGSRIKNKIAYYSNNKNLDSVKLFINAVMKASSVDLTRVTIIVIADDDSFISRLRDGIIDGGHPDYIRKIIAVPVIVKLTPDSYFILDNHLTPKGHEIIANEIMKGINLHE